jgi:hypothetical protein
MRDGDSNGIPFGSSPVAGGATFECVSLVLGVSTVASLGDHA